MYVNIYVLCTCICVCECVCAIFAIPVAAVVCLSMRPHQVVRGQIQKKGQKKKREEIRTLYSAKQHVK